MVHRHTRRDFLRYTAVGAGVLGASLGTASGALAAGSGDGPTQGEGPGPNPPGNPWARAEYISATVRAPHFPNRWFDVTDHGAVAGGEVDCSGAFRDAIAACHAAGGGHVVVRPATS